ncbi:UNVERIFIED_CONTAM: hypothetical protein GTU68_042623, partial [Idotea baltica]|nr:hypothetical protein [Idotea baltica]
VDIRAYKVFLNLAQTLHFGRTAALTDLSPSAISRHLQRLEAHVGQVLIERDNRQVQLTPAGRHFLEYARKAVGDWQQIRADLDVSTAKLSGEVSVFGSVTASYSMLSQILPTMRDTHPGIEIKLRTGDQADAMDRVVAGTEDSAIIAVPTKLPRKLACLPLRKTPLCLIAPTIPSALTSTVDEYVKRAEEPDWSQLPVVLAERGLARTRFLERMKSLNCEPRIYAQVAGHEAVVSMVSLGFGVAVVPSLVIEHSPIRDTVRVLPYFNDLAPFELGLCAHEERLSDPLLNAFWSCAANTYPQK